jgi:hypothetical protein
MKSLQWRILATLLFVLPAAVAGAQGMGDILGNRASKTVGVPFSADWIDESTQTLADGNRIHREARGKIFRDSEGRTRTETESGGGADQGIVIIWDPVAQVSIVLNTQTKAATVRHFPKPPSESAAIAAPKPPMPAAKSEKLESKEIEGFTVSGSRRFIIMEAGQDGNDKPITKVNEIWYSPVLKAVLLSSHEDPRGGGYVTRLTNIRMSEPDPLLFRVPSDYTVKEQ